MFVSRRPMTDTPPIHTVILAAGASRRLGFNKLLVRVGGEPLVRKTAKLFMDACPGRVIVVTGFEGDLVAAALQGLPVDIVANPRHAGGMSTSVKAVLPHLVDADAVLFHLGDKAFVTRETVRRVIEAGLSQTGTIVVPRWGTEGGHPVLIRVGPYLAEMAAIDGDRGLRDIIERHHDDVLFVEGDEGVILDVDTMEDIEGLKRRGLQVEKAQG